MQHGQYHRTDGPAIEHKETKQWRIDGKNLTEKDFNTYTKTRSDYNWISQYKPLSEEFIEIIAKAVIKR